MLEPKSSGRSWYLPWIKLILSNLSGPEVTQIQCQSANMVFMVAGANPRFDADLMQRSKTILKR
ncbi:hypothetical protein IQ266_01035 [filamentous cyanobacterium LEGE 11480]|uniref:Uncharacterized protein n=1 Tax=Romeriopsis navalis LEGE 11480 TaxID=2777977 RepID=A0A928Z1B4_9CYAN|nr:hypothetical protein [Romeriopsis navalis]MBE9028339.1 hypothetical protein [Romeriopsis navalis LEGE 11480]